MSKGILDFINEKYASKKIMSELEENMHEKLPSLDIVFNRYYGISIDEYIMNRRINAAKEMLRFSVLPIEDIAKKSGLGEGMVMQQMFRQTEGMSCEEYRSKWAAWIRA